MRLRVRQKEQMRAVLGIDAAWTLTQPSGVAVAAELHDGWHLIAAAASYQRFQALVDDRHPAEKRPSGSLPNASTLLASASALCGRPVDLVAIDMPLARSPIVGRRTSDNAVSRAYGGRKCGTHTPSTSRPGRISSDLREAFERAGYPLLTDTIAPLGAIEVYPHPALVELAGASERLPYKALKGSELLALGIPAGAASSPISTMERDRSAPRRGDYWCGGGYAKARVECGWHASESLRRCTRRHHLRVGWCVCFGRASDTVR